jgi:hypothetical protein
MADRKITEFGAITPANTAADDVLPLVDISQASGDDKNKKITLDNLSKCVSDGAAATPSIAFRDDQDTGLFSPSANNLAVTTGGSERLRIDDSGRLLINKTSTSASQKLQVDGSADIGGVLIEKSASNNNISIGSGFASLLGTAEANVALGVNALSSLTSGDFNVAIGYESLKDNDAGGRNTAVGYRALENNTSANNNTAFGYYALQQCATTQGYNSAFGSSSFYNLTNGQYNTGFGSGAGYSVGTGSFNTAVGASTLGYPASRTNVAGNTCLGHTAMYQVGNDAQYNTAIGNASLKVTSGSYNTCLGFGSGEDITTGSGNIVIGDRTASGSSSPVITLTTADNRVVMGSTAVTNAYIQVAWTTVSDERDKLNFATVPHGIDFVKQLNPVAFQFRESRESDVAVGPVRYGFKAQEIMALEGDAPVIIDKEDSNRLRYQGESLVPVLVNAMKEQQQQIEALQARLNDLEAS